MASPVTTSCQEPSTIVSRNPARVPLLTITPVGLIPLILGKWPHSLNRLAAFDGRVPPNLSQMIAAGKGTVCCQHSCERGSDSNLGFNRAAVVGECHIPRELAILLGSDGKLPSRCGGCMKRSPVASRSSAVLQAGTTAIANRIRAFKREVIDLSAKCVQDVVVFCFTSVRYYICPHSFCRY